MNNLTGVGYLRSPEELKRKKELIARLKLETEAEDAAERSAYDLREAIWKNN